MVNYSRAILYKITSPLTGKVFIGCSVSGFSQVQAAHVYNLRGIRKQSYVGMEYEHQPDDPVLTLIKKVPCKSKQELQQIHQECIDEHMRLDFILSNKNRAAIGEINCKCGGKYMSNRKQHHKDTIQHRLYLKENNPVEAKDKNDIYGTPMKPVISLACVCGGRYAKNHIKKHQQSQRHTNFITQSQT